jgi:hypothetical protein
MLTVLTPTFRRPVGLKMCQASVAGQHRTEQIQHLVVRDDVGLGVGGMYAALPQVNDLIRGAWVYVLSDDDVLIYPRVVDLISTVELEQPDTAVIMVRMLCNGRILPWPQCWEAPPQCGGVTLSNWIVRRDAHIATPYGARYEGDYDHVTALWSKGYKFAWVDVIVAASQDGAHHGQPE